MLSPQGCRGRVAVRPWPSGPGGRPERRRGAERGHGGGARSSGEGAGCRQTSQELPTASWPGMPEDSASRWVSAEGRLGTLCPLD